MKKLFSLLLALILCFSLVACGDTGPDKQPAIDSYNVMVENYNAFVDVANQHLDEFSEEDIEFFNGCADVITEYGEKLESDAELTQEELDEMVEMFDEFNAIIVEGMTAFE